MAYTHINRGTAANDGTGDNARAGAQIINDNFDQVEADLALKADLTYSEETYLKAGDVYLGNQIVNLSYTESATAYTAEVIWIKWSIAGSIDEAVYNQTITFTAPDGTFNRLDRVVFNISDFTVYKVDGTASAAPQPPALENDELHLFYKLVVTGTTAPNYITDYKLYDENLQEAGGEYDTTVTANVTSDSSTSPSNGTYHIAFSSASNGNYIQFSHSTPIAASEGTLRMKFRQPTAHNFRFNVTANNGSIDYALATNINNTALGLSTVTTWQDLVIPLNPNLDISTLRITNTRNGSTIWFDEIYIQTNTEQGTIGSIAAQNVTVNPDNFTRLTAENAQEALEQIDAELQTIDGGTP